MKIVVFGLGQLGVVTATLLAEHGAVVIGVDVDGPGDSVDAPAEPGLSKRMTAALNENRLRILPSAAVPDDWRFAFVCVETLSDSSGRLNTSTLISALNRIGEQLRRQPHYSVVAIRTAIPAHLLRELVSPTLTNASGAPPGEKYGLVVTPAFLRETVALIDFLNPPFTLIGESDRRAGDMIEALFEFVAAPVLRMNMREAMMAKHVFDTFQNLKSAFANEISLICTRDGTDGAAVMKALNHDMNLAGRSHRLIGKFQGGPPRVSNNLDALTNRARQLEISTPLLDAMLASAGQRYEP